MPERDRMGLPLRPFMYTLDQICSLTALTDQQLKDKFLHFEGRSVGPRPDHLMKAINIGPPKSKPDWRVEEREFIRWLRSKGFRIYDRSVTV